MIDTKETTNLPPSFFFALVVITKGLEDLKEITKRDGLLSLGLPEGLFSSRDCLGALPLSFWRFSAKDAIYSSSSSFSSLYI